MGGTGASTGEWLSPIKFITLWHLGCRWWAAHASQVTGRGVVEGDPVDAPGVEAAGVDKRKRLSVRTERKGPDTA